MPAIWFRLVTALAGGSEAHAAVARATLAGYHWPGNVRELSNVLERVALLSEAFLIGADLLNLPGDEGAGEGGSATGNDSRRSSDLRE